MFQADEVLEAATGVVVVLTACLLLQLAHDDDVVDAVVEVAHGAVEIDVTMLVTYTVLAAGVWFSVTVTVTALALWVTVTGAGAPWVTVTVFADSVTVTEAQELAEAH